jgi:hypothetical protein
MSVNKYQPHILILPDDDANRQLANGFDRSVAHRQFQILPPAGGWGLVCDLMASDHAGFMRRYPNRFMVLLIDFDDQPNRLEHVKSRIPEDLHERVFVLGALTDPEDLRQALGSYETIGGQIATDCRNDSQAIWDHELLQHNASELLRVRDAVRNFLFPA